MLSEFFDSPLRIRALSTGPAGAHFAGFADALFHVGYAELTARRHIRAAEHFLFWADQHGLLVREVDEQSLVRFDRHLGHCRCPRFGCADRRNMLRGVRLFLSHLRTAGLITARVVDVPPPDPALYTAFCEWMRQQRGTCDRTLYNYGIPIRGMLRRLGDDPRQFDARSVREFLLAESRRGGWAAAKGCTTALRMFLRFLIVDGRCAAELDAAIPVLAHWRLSALPGYLPPDDVERLIASCDTASPVGRRDRAILLLLARLGLRAGDIVQLRLSDIDWTGAWILVCGKGRRDTRLPLSQEVGQALVMYLQESRPRTDVEAFFVRSRAPFRAFRSHAAVSVIVGRAFARAAVTRPSRGAAHLLRHSVAVSMLRHGASLQDIAGLLRHRSIETTQIYAKVDVTALRQIAQPWPAEVPSC